MREQAAVYLKADFKGLEIGTKGVIVHEYDGTAFEVEFFDTEGSTIEVLTTPANMIGSVNDK